MNNIIISIQLVFIVFVYDLKIYNYHDTITLKDFSIKFDTIINT